MGCACGMCRDGNGQNTGCGSVFPLGCCQNSKPNLVPVSIDHKTFNSLEADGVYDISKD